MNDLPHGYRILRLLSGSIYGEFKQGNIEGQVYHKWENDYEYCGEYKNNKKWGEAVIKENGQLYRDKYEADIRISRSKISEGS